MNGEPNGPILFPTPAEKEAREKSEYDRHKKRENSLQFRFNALLTVCAVMSAAFVFYQNRILKLTLEASVRQAKASEEAVKVAIDTLGAMKSAPDSSDAIARQAAIAEDARAEKALKGSATQNMNTIRSATTQMRLDQRAWIGFVADNISFVNAQRNYPADRVHELRQDPGI